MRLVFASTFRLLTLVSLAALASCSILRDLSSDQCELDSDCDARGGRFVGRQCVAGICVAPPGGSSGAGAMSSSGGDDSSGGSSTIGGSTSGGASAMNGGTSATSGGAAGAGGSSSDPECTTHAECLDKNAEASVCIDGSCIPLLSPDCPVVLPLTNDLWMDNLRTANPIIFGGFATVPSTLVGLQTRNYDLALTEFTRKVSGLPGANGVRRALVEVVCRANYAAASNLDASMNHLVDDLHVPGVVTALLAQDVQHVFETKAQAAHVMLMSPLESDSTLVSLQDNGLVWQLLPGGNSVSVTYAPLLDRTVAYLTAQGALTSGETVRVALVTATDVRFLSDMSDTVSSTITFNGKSASDNLNDGNFKPIAITSVYTDPTADLSSQVQALLAFKPHVIIAAAADEFLSNMVPSIESGWAAAAGSQAPPFYLLSAYHFNNPKLPPLLISNPSVRTRLAGVNEASAVDQTLYNTYQIAFDTAYPDVAGQRGYENFYDAQYYLLYSAAAAGSVQTLTGDDLARGMARLLSGPSFGVGQNDIPNALSSLQSSSEATIALSGTDGPPTFDPGTGSKVGPGSVWCVDSSSVQQADVLRYDSTTMGLTGTFPCITGF
jgi:hypothetical protein